MHGHHHDKHHMHEEFSGGEYGFATAADRDRFIGAMRGRGGGRGRGRGRGWGGDSGRHGGFGPGFGRGPRAGRGDVRAAILALLAEEPMHGYQIITELTERSRGVWQPSPGSVYPTLQVMEDQGLVTAEKSEGRRVFTLTEAGRAEAATLADASPPWEEAARSADRSLVDLRGLMAEVARATMQVARVASDRQVKAVGEILDETRRKIYLILAEGSRIPTTEADDEDTSTAGPGAATAAGDA